MTYEKYIPAKEHPAKIARPEGFDNEKYPSRQGDKYTTYGAPKHDCVGKLADPRNLANN